MKESFWKFIRWLDEPVVVPVCLRIGLFILIMAAMPLFIGLIAVHSPYCAVVLFGLDVHLFVQCLKMEHSAIDDDTDGDSSE